MAPRGYPRFAVLAAAGAIVMGLAPDAFAAWPIDPAVNLALCNAANSQINVQACTDGAGGAIAAWQDPRTGSADIYARRVRAAGVAIWTVDGVAICTAGGPQIVPRITPDGNGGAFIAWEDNRGGASESDVYVQRVDSLGVPQWTANGIAAGAESGIQNAVALVADGAGGVFLVWQDARSGTPDIYAQRLNGAGVPQWAVNGVQVCGAPNDQENPQIALDGQGGIIATWSDLRSGNYDIYAQRVNGSGAAQWTVDGVGLAQVAANQTAPVIASDLNGATVAWVDARNGGQSDIYAQRVNSAGAPQWTPNGVVVCNSPNGQANARIASDGFGGAFVVWDDFRDLANQDLYAQRLGAGGIPAWGANGTPVCTAFGNQSAPQIAPDGAGGMLVAWGDPRTGQHDAYAQRVSASGTMLWDANGVPVSIAAGNQTGVVPVADGTGGAVLVWNDTRSGLSDIDAQRLDRYGRFGTAEPAIASVRDVPNDQGGRVKLSWFGSYLDLEPRNAIADYWIFRSAPPGVALAARSEGARFVRLGAEHAPAEGRWFDLETFGAATIFWEYLTSIPATHDEGYSYVAATTSDSVPGSNPRTLFRVQARTTNGAQYWNSPPDSGYSVDNLAPATPAPFTGTYLDGATHLHWSRNTEADLAGYRLYRGTSPGFVPGPGNLVAAPPDTGYADAGAAGSYYKLSAVDSHGNASVPALLTPGTTTDVPGGAADTRLALAVPWPNPVGPAGTRLGFVLPRVMVIELAVFDASGRRTLTLTRGEQPAGEHAIRWNARDAEGRRLGSGLYWVVLTAGGERLSQRFAVMR